MCCALERQQTSRKNFSNSVWHNGISIFSFFLQSVTSSLEMKGECWLVLKDKHWSGNTYSAMSIWKVFITLYSYSKNHRFMVLSWLFHGLRLDVIIFQAQSFTSPQSFRLPLNFSLGFENSFRIKLAVVMKLWHFNRNHQMTFKHDHVVQ